MRIVGSLLARGNSQLGESIHNWSIPAGETCPGQSELCAAHCYAKHGFYFMPDVKGGLARRLLESRQKGFVKKMIKEIGRKGALVVRVHVSGDFYSAGYARKWLEVVRSCPKTTFYWYTRSWRVAKIRPVLEEMAALPNVRGWYSTDAETGDPEDVPESIRVAFMQVEEGQAAPDADLAFRVPKVRDTPRVGLPMVCPKNLTRGKPEINCGTCQKCWS